MKYLKLEIGNDLFDEPKRVLTFGKFKGHTIKEVYDIDGFKDELNETELEISESDYFRGVSSYGRDDWEDIFVACKI